VGRNDFRLDELTVIASEAKQSTSLREAWIASSLALLAMTILFRAKYQSGSSN
jgi:hypothetical protein